MDTDQDTNRTSEIGATDPVGASGRGGPGRGVHAPGERSHISGVAEPTGGVSPSTTASTAIALPGYTTEPTTAAGTDDAPTPGLVTRARTSWRRWLPMAVAVTVVVGLGVGLLFAVLGVRHRNDTIAALRDDVGSLESDVADRDDTIDGLETDITGLHQDLSSLESRRAACDQALDGMSRNAQLGIELSQILLSVIGSPYGFLVMAPEIDRIIDAMDVESLLPLIEDCRDQLRI